MMLMEVAQCQILINQSKCYLHCTFCTTKHQVLHRSWKKHTKKNLTINSLCWGCVHGLHPRWQHCSEKVLDRPGSPWADSRLSCTSPLCPGSNMVTAPCYWLFMTWCLLCGGWAISVTHLRCEVIEAYLVANLSTQSALHLLGHPLCHCDGSHSAGLSDDDFSIFTNTYTKVVVGVL